MGAGAIAGLLIWRDYEKRADGFDLSKIGEVPQRSAVYDINGELYSYLNGENRLVVPLDSVSRWFVQALLAREDSRFWEHQGVDYMGIARAMVTNLRSGDVKQGASTITQQLARNALELSGKNYDRKALEAALARRIERTFSKKEVLELYVNRIYFGSGFYGIETASRGYFGKSASELDLGESAILAGLIRSPNRFSPRNNLEAALGERDTVLGRMRELNMIADTDVEAARTAKVVINHQTPLRYQEDYVMDAVTRELEQLLDRDVIEFGGLRIFTTIDPALQKLALEAADRQLTKIEEQKNYPHPRKADYQPSVAGEPEKPTDYLQAAVVAVDNRTGAVRAIVGGRDYSHSKYSRALLSKRQIGSTFKPFVYAAAFERGLLPGHLISDDKIEPSDIRTVSNKDWSPVNSDGDYLGLQPAAVGLIRSRNTMTVRVGEFAGMKSVHQLAKQVGIGESMLELPVSYLGAFETNLKDLTASYTTFANLGVYHSPYLIARVEDGNGGVVFSKENMDKRVLPQEVAWMTSAILQHVMQSGTAAKAKQLGWKKHAGGKTGTTNDFHDAWFVGYTTSLTCGVWVGMDKPQTIMEKGYGSALALPIWVDFMNQVPEKTYPATAFEAPFQVVKLKMCSSSGARATTQCELAKTTYESSFPVNRVPREICTVHVAPPPMYSYQTTPPASDPFYPRTFAGSAPVAPTSPTPPASTPSTPVQSGAGYVQAQPQPTPPPARVVRVERTTEGLRIYPGIEPQRPAESSQPVRVMRAIPVDPHLRRTPTPPEPIAEEEPVRVYRAQPVERRNPPRTVRLVPRDPDDEEDD
jgi:penicillin-binding protein 1A